MEDCQRIKCKTLEELKQVTLDTTSKLMIILDFPKDVVIPELFTINGLYTLIGDTTVSMITNNIAIHAMHHNSSVQRMYGDSRIWSMYGNSSVHSMYNRSTIINMQNKSTVRCMTGRSSVHYMFDSSIVQQMYKISTVQQMCGTSIVQNMYDNSNVETLQHNSMIHNMWDISSVQCAMDTGVIEHMWADSRCFVFSSSFSRSVRINAHHQAIVTSVLPLDEITGITLSDQARFQQKFGHTPETFCQKYHDNMVDKDTIRLYKVVKEDHTDFWTGTIKYEGTVECPDWDRNPRRPCGGGLHLSPTPELALEYNQGKVLECYVKLEDIVVYPYDVTKVRCRKVEVISCV